MRLIDADALLHKMQTEYNNTDRLIEQGETHLDTLAEGYTEVHGLILSQPTIDPDSLMPHGRWEEYLKFSDGQVGSYCSECHHGAVYSPQCPDRYCGGCGAKMDAMDVEDPDAG